MDETILFNHFPNLSEKQKEQFSLLSELYKDWNMKINVVSRKDIDELYRVENVKGKFDFIVSRAVAAMPTFVHWIKGKIKKESVHEIKNGILYLKGGDLSEELKDYRTAQVFNLSDYFDDEFYETKKVVYLPLKYKG